jgi:hypothetical protein
MVNTYLAGLSSIGVHAVVPRLLYISHLIFSSPCGRRAPRSPTTGAVLSMGGWMVGPLRGASDQEEALAAGGWSQPRLPLPLEAAEGRRSATRPGRFAAGIPEIAFFALPSFVEKKWVGVAVAMLAAEVRSA